MIVNKVIGIVLLSVECHVTRSSLSLLLLGWWQASIVTGQSFIQRLEPPLPASFFGSAIDFDDRTAVVGGRLRTDSSSRPALISIFEMTEGRWEENTSILFPCGVLATCQPSVDLDGDRAVVSNSQLFGVGTYILERGPAEWDVVAQLDVGPGKTPLAVAMDDNRILVGSVLAAYVLENVNDRWTQTATLVPPAIVAESRLGEFVIMENDTAFISAYGYQGHGAVFMFQEGADGQWNLKSTIEPLIPVNGQQFGRSFSLDNNRLVVGAPNSPGGGDVYVFEFDGSAWNETAILHAFDGGTAGFGASVSIDGDRLIVNDGDFGDSIGSLSTSAYVLTDGAWRQEFVIPAERYGLGASFRMWDSVELRGSIALVGGDGYAGLITVPETMGAHLAWLAIVWLMRRSRRRPILNRPSLETA